MAQDPLDELYRADPSGFVSTRNRIAAERKAAGDADGAAAVKALRKPSKAAWVVNRLALEHPDDVSRLDDAAQALKGARDARALREAVETQRSILTGLNELARGVAADAGLALNATVAERVTETLQAATTDDEVRAAVIAGRLDKERKVATLGAFEALSLSPAGDVEEPDEDGEDEELREAREEVSALEEAHAEAVAGAEAAGEAVARAERELAEAERAAKKAAAEETKAAKALEKARKRLAKLED